MTTSVHFTESLTGHEPKLRRTVTGWLRGQRVKILTKRKLCMDRFGQSLLGGMHETSQRKQTLTTVGVYWLSNMFTGRRRADTL